jgi:transcriptional regulator with XRE-family HTH domain
MATRKRKATKLLEELAGGPLTLGRYICSIREGEEMSQVEFARKLGISKSHLCDIEKGRKPVSAARAAEMARVLGYSEKQFVLLALQDAMKRAGLDYHVRISAA